MQRALLGVVAAAALLGAPGPACALEASEVTALAERHYRQLYGFSALEAYQAQRGTQSSEFVVARRWRGDGVDVVVDVIKPEEAAKWAFLFRQNLGQPDDFFIYIPLPGFRRVRRFGSSYQESNLPFVFVPLREIRPFLPGELEYTFTEATEIEGVHCVVIGGRPVSRQIRLDRVELAISETHGISLRTRYFRDGAEVRRVLVSPGDIRAEGERLIPMRRRLIRQPSGEETEVLLRNFLLDPELPDRFFTHHNLRVQRFPSF
jgi:hypothetical protein